jgi:TRAP-type mannitol/chloroaromatic compound transport system permease small subunit
LPILNAIGLIDRVTEAIGRAIAWLLLAMVLATVLVVVLRYALNQGSVMLQETVMYLHGITFMLGIPFALKQDAHVRVDLIYSALGRRARLIVNLVGHLLFLVPVAIAIIVYSHTYVANAWRILERSPEVGGLPATFLLKTLIPVMASLLLLQGLAEIARCILELRRRDG